MMALCAVWNWESRPRKVPEGGLQGAILEGHMEKILCTFSMMKVLRTFSGPVLNDDVIESPFSGYIAFVDEPLLVHFHFSFSKELQKAPQSYEVIESKLELRLREREKAPSQKGPLVQVYSSPNGGPVYVLIVPLERLDPCRRVRLMLGDGPNTLVYELYPNEKSKNPRQP